MMLFIRLTGYCGKCFSLNVPRETIHIILLKIKAKDLSVDEKNLIIIKQGSIF